MAPGAFHRGFRSVRLRLSGWLSRATSAPASAAPSPAPAAAVKVVVPPRNWLEQLFPERDPMTDLDRLLDGLSCRAGSERARGDLPALASLLDREQRPAPELPRFG